MSLEEGLLLEAGLFGRACDSKDSKEETKAFLEKGKQILRANKGE